VAVTDHRAGLVAGVGAYLLWGLFPLYWPLLEPAAPVEILAHRITWSLLFLVAVLAATTGFRYLRGLGRRRILQLTLAAVLVTVNWGTFIYAVNSEHVVETSLGYFINPLVTVALAVFVLHEHLRPRQRAAVAIAGIGVAVLAVDYGRPPWIALTLAGTFALYGLMKKIVRTEAAPGLFVETLLVAVPAVVVLGVLHGGGDGTFGNAGTGHALLLVGSGVATAVPLLLFAAAARRIPLSTVGLLQYITPLMQLAIGVFVYDEPMPPARLAGFAIVWVALAVFTADMLRHARATSRRVVVETVPAGL
jgi:chloramphenicol-sensitive protein RarD